MRENYPRFLGVYEGAMGHEDVCAYVESSDCLLLLGVPVSDIDLGINTAHLDPARSISVGSDCVAIGHAVYEDVLLADVLQGLLDADLPRATPPAYRTPRSRAPSPPCPASRSRPPGYSPA
ncbi:MAG TPA: hypothetical protein VII06_14470 [Chloroflexota bacterium]